MDRERGIHVGHTLENTGIDGMPTVKIGVDAFVETEPALPTCLIGRQRTRQTTHTVSFDHTLVIVIGDRGTIAAFLLRTRERDIMRVADSRTQQGILIIIVSTVVIGTGHTALTDIAAPLVGRQQVEFLGSRSKGHITIILDSVLLHVATLTVGRHDNDTIGTTATVDGGCRGILQNIHRHDFTGLYGVDIHTRDTIDHHQWAIRCRE